MKTRIAAIFLLAFLPLASADAADVAKFRIGGEEFSWKLPEGYCLPRGEYEALAQAGAASDTANVTDVTAYVCDKRGVLSNEYILLKTPTQALLAKMSRAELLNGLGAEFDKPELAAALKSDEMDKQVSTGLTKVFGPDIATKSAIAPLMRDEVCAYMGGKAVYTFGAKSEAAAVAICVTAVRNKIISFNVYSDFKDISSVSALLPRVRGFALDVIAQNENR
jgi:hypothetical protein